MKTTFRFLAIAAAFFSVLSCTRELENTDKEETPQSLHYVHFVADAPETKTNLDIPDGGDVVVYSWTDSDECDWKPENGDCRWTIVNKTKSETAKSIFAIMDKDNCLSILAGFESDVTVGDVLYAQYNKSVSSSQTYTTESLYHQESDVMISNEITVQDGENTEYCFSFKREIAFAQMKLKGMTPNGYVSNVTIESDKPIAGLYNRETASFDSETSTTIVLNNVDVQINENGEATVYFAIIPVEDANLTVTVETLNAEHEASDTYRKTFARPISFVKGDVRAFGVACQRVSLEEIKLYSTEFNYSISGSSYMSPKEIEGKDAEGGTAWGITYGNWNGSQSAQFRVYSSSSNGGFGSLYMKFDLPRVSKVEYKAKVILSNTNVRLNTYYSIDSGNSWIEVDNNKSLTTNLESYSFVVSSKGEFENVRVKFAAAGSRSSANEELTIDDVVIYGVEYGTPKYNISIETVEGGELSATAASAKEGTEIILTATPDAGYEFKSWDVTDSKEKTVDIVDNKFSMPASDVTVSGTFSKIDYTITKTESGRGSIVAKKGAATVETAQIGDEITLSATPNEGYEFISWTVVDSEENSVEVVDNKFTMPASNVTVSATFNSTASYTVSFSVNGNVTTESYKETEKIEFPDVPAQDGVQFMGWATSDFSGIVSSKPELVDVNRAVMGTNDITYYAVFGVIETAVFDPNDLSATPAVSGQTLTWKHTATGVTLKLSAGQLYTGTPKTFTVNGGTNNYFQISSDKNYIISEIETTLSESKYKINSVSSGATLSGSGTTQTVKSDNQTSIKCYASSYQIRATKITVTALTGYSTQIITLDKVEVSGTPAKMEYTVDDAFEPAGLTVTGTYSNGESSTITEGISWTCTPSTFDAPGNKSVSVTATVKSIESAAYNVNVTVKTIANTLAATDKSINVNTNLDVKTLFTTNSNAEIKYTLVENPSDAGTLTGTTFSATAAGTYKVQASQAVTNKYSAAEVTATITVTTAPSTKSYTIQFATATNDSNQAMTESTSVSDIVSSGSEYVSGFTSNCSKAYKGTKGVKLGTSSKAGTLEFTLTDLVKNNVVSIKVTTVQYGSDSSTITMYNGSTSLISDIGQGEATYEFNTPTSVSSLKFESTKRQYISEVVITCKQ